MKPSERFPFFRPALLAAGLLLLQVTAGSAQVGKLLPVDEAVRDLDLFAFRAQLQAVVARHDVTALLAMMDPQIELDFGGGAGIEELKKTWGLPGKDSRLWGELGTLLALGGAFKDKDTFLAPYVFQSWPRAFDAFEHVVAIGTGVNVRSEPALNGQILAKLSFDIVRVSSAAREKLTPKQAEEWSAVELKDGRVGYVSSRYVRNPIDYRAALSRRGGSWRVTTLIAGD